MNRLDPLFGIHADALALQRQRMDVLASNIANADTPNYLARDIDFGQVLSNRLEQARTEQAMVPTDPNHMAETDSRHITVGQGDESGLMYRTPLQPAADGNTVDTQIEQAAYADAAMHYQASLSFMNGRVRSMLTAISGQ